MLITTTTTYSGWAKGREKDPGTRKPNLLLLLFGAWNISIKKVLSFPQTMFHGRVDGALPSGVQLDLFLNVRDGRDLPTLGGASSRSV